MCTVLSITLLPWKYLFFSHIARILCRFSPAVSFFTYFPHKKNVPLSTGCQMAFLFLAKPCCAMYPFFFNFNDAFFFLGILFYLGTVLTI